MRGYVVKKSSENNNYSVMNRIMLRFRPIAPKPPGGENVSDAADLEKRNGSVKRTKRKYVRVRCRQSKRKSTTKQGILSSPHEKSAVVDSPPPVNGFVTLQLLPEKSESEQICPEENNTVKKMERNFIDQFIVQDEMTAGEGGALAQRSVISTIDSWIIVECVSETVTGVGLGFSDRDKICKLEAETCPGFVSDFKNQVVWINEAYRKMVGGGEGAAEAGVVVWLVVKEKLPYMCPSFACRVRLIMRRREGQKWNMIVPCDVWRMESEGFAWKMDVNTALSLGI